MKIDNERILWSKPVEGAALVYKKLAGFLVRLYISRMKATDFRGVKLNCTCRMVGDSTCVGYIELRPWKTLVSPKPKRKRVG